MTHDTASLLSNLCLSNMEGPWPLKHSCSMRAEVPLLRVSGQILKHLSTGPCLLIFSTAFPSSLFISICSFLSSFFGLAKLLFN